MMKIICVDDDPIQHQNLKQLFELSEHEIQANFYYNSDELFFDIEDFSSFDAIFLDVEMDKLNGLEIAEKLRADGHQIPIVFLTGYSQYAIDGYSVQAFDYILKPITLEKVNILLDRLDVITKKGASTVLLIDSIEGTRREKEDDILGFEAQGDYIRLILAHESYLVKSSLSQMIKNLGDSFITCHRSYLVNLKHIDSFDKEEIILSNKERIPISRRSRSEVHNKISDYYQKGDYQL